MSRRRKSGEVRYALPPLRGKEVELVSITKQHMVDLHSVRLLVNGQPYRILKAHCRDELDVLVWLAKLKDKEGANQ